MQNLQYPIGNFSWDGKTDMSSAEANIERIAALPGNLRQAVEKLDQSEWEKPYRPGGWNTRQVVNHVVDSHMNAYLRVKWAITEDQPVIKPYEEALWATTPEYELSPLTALHLLEALHLRWVSLLRSLTPEQLDRTYFHPQQNRYYTLHEVLALYAWHGDHHCAHVKSLVI